MHEAAFMTGDRWAYEPAKYRMAAKPLDMSSLNSIGCLVGPCDPCNTELNILLTVKLAESYYEIFNTNPESKYLSN